MGAKLIDLTGQTYGYLTVINLHNRKPSGALIWHLKCICGGDVYRVKAGFINGKYVSCGCMRGKNKIIHNESHGKSTEYTIYCLIKGRCYNPNNQAYKNYGGRGVIMCDRWLYSYNNFLTDMGRRPSLGHSIDRINNDGNYEPSNCRWAIKEIQANNTRANKFIEYQGQVKTLSQWCRLLGLPIGRTGYRLRKGWDATKAFEVEKLINQYSVILAL